MVQMNHVMTLRGLFQHLPQIAACGLLDHSHTLPGHLCALPLERWSPLSVKAIEDAGSPKLCHWLAWNGSWMRLPSQVHVCMMSLVSTT